MFLLPVHGFYFNAGAYLEDRTSSRRSITDHYGVG